VVENAGRDGEGEVMGNLKAAPDIVTETMAQAPQPDLKAFAEQYEKEIRQAKEADDMTVDECLEKIEMASKKTDNLAEAVKELQRRQAQSKTGNYSGIFP